MKHYILTGMFLLAGCCFGFAQTDPVKENTIEKLIENISENAGESEIDYTTLLDDLNYFYDNPINLNSATRDDLSRLGLLTDYQIAELFRYQKKYGQLVTIYELQNINGWDKDVLFYVLPFVRVGKIEEKRRLYPKTVFKYGKNDFILRYTQNAEKAAGFSMNDTNATKGYLGSPFALQFRYRFTYKNKVSFGFTADKDRGEQFFSGYNKQGFDFYSGHIFIRDLGPLKKLAIGDFQAQFGQGLTYWSGFSFRKSAFPLNIKRYPVGLKQYTATNEFNYNRGIGAEFEFGPVSVTGFYSIKQLDGNLSQLDTLTGEALEFSSFLQTGYHRTLNEIADRNSILEMIGGGNITYKGKIWNIGITGTYTWYNAPLKKSDDLYNKYEFQGQELGNVGVNYNVLLGKIFLFGELAFSHNGGYALTQGIQTSLSPNFNVALMYRDFARNYQVQYSAPFADRFGAQNERGVYIGFEAVPFKKSKMQGYIDVFQYPWLRFGVDAPSWGYDALFQFTYLPAKKVETYFRVRHSNRQENSTINDTYTDPLVNISRTTYRLHATYEVSSQLKFKTRTDFITLSQPDKPFRWGFLVYQDIIYRPAKVPLSLSARVAIFNTDDFDTRLYAYENDVLYSFSVPAYYYKGMRFYVNMKWEIRKGLSLWFRVAQTYIANRQVISSGLDQINGNTRTEFKVQLRWRFSAANFKQGDDD